MMRVYRSYLILFVLFTVVACNSTTDISLSALTTLTPTPTPTPTITELRIASATTFNEFGAGVDGDPYLLYNSTQLVDLATHCSETDGTSCTQYYQLAADINMAGVVTTPIGWEPDNIFVGNFDGNDHSVTNLTLALNTGDVGFFGALDGTVTNLSLLNANISGSAQNYAILTGVVPNNAVIDNVHVSGVVNSSNSYVGGLLGNTWNNVSISNSSSSATISGLDNVGGLAGTITTGTIHASFATGSVTGTNNVGGILGLTDLGWTIVTESYATGDISGELRVGGLIGFIDMNNFEISRSYATGTVTGIDDVGGLLGLGWAGEIYDSYATGNISGVDGDIGGLIGDFGGLVYRCYATGNVTGSVGYTYTGGLVGACYGTIDSSFATGVVVSEFDGPAGGLEGDAACTKYNNFVLNPYDQAIVLGQLGQLTALSDLYNPLHDVYTDYPWDFTTIWSAPGDQLPTLR